MHPLQGWNSLLASLPSYWPCSSGLESSLGTREGLRRRCLQLLRPPLCRSSRLFLLALALLHSRSWLAFTWSAFLPTNRAESVRTWYKTQFPTMAPTQVRSSTEGKRSWHFSQVLAQRAPGQPGPEGTLCEVEKASPLRHVEVLSEQWVCEKMLFLSRFVGTVQLGLTLLLFLKDSVYLGNPCLAFRGQTDHWRGERRVCSWPFLMGLRWRDLSVLPLLGFFDL